MARMIPLTQGKYVIVDDEDYAELSRYKWQVIKGPKTYYAKRDSSRPRRRTVLMHRQIMNAQPRDEIDHENHRGWDNRKVNIRFCTRSENSANQLPRGGTSKYKGVSWHEKNQIWYAYIKVNRKRIYLGCYESEIEAAKSYDNAAINYFGEFANTNFELTGVA